MKTRSKRKETQAQLENLRTAMDIYRVERPLDVVAFCEQYRVLTAGSEPGPWRSKRVPFWCEPMRTCCDPRVREVVIMGAAQTAKTESAILNILAWKIVNSPAPSLLVLPTLEAVRSFSRDRVEPMIEACDLLRPLVADSQGVDAESTIFRKAFPHGHLTMVGSHAASGLSRMPIRDRYLSEMDRYATSAGLAGTAAEGDPVQLARVRTSTFYNSKIIMESSPTIAGRSRIEAAFAMSTQEYWYLSCPLCKHHQIMNWAQLSLTDFTYSCEACGGSAGQAAWQASPGEWRAHGESTTVRGFHLSALPCPLIRWETLAEEWKRANELKRKGDLSQLQVFINTRLSEPWQEESLEPGEQAPPLRSENYAAEIPDGVLTLVASIDSQDDRLEYLVMGVGAERIYWLIEAGVIWGNLSVDSESMYKEVDQKILDRDWHTAKGKILRIYRATQDLLGHHSDVVRTQARRRGRVLIPFSGRAEGVKRLMYEIVAPGDGRGVFLSGATGMAKDLIVQLRKAGRIHVPTDDKRGFDEHWLAQLDSEARITKYRSGVPTTFWVKRSSHVRNEALDLLSMAIILSESLRLRPDRKPDYYLGEAGQRKERPTYGAQAVLSLGNPAAHPPPRQHSRYGVQPRRGVSF